MERIQADLDKDIYDYFFKHVIAWTHGSRQAIINFTFQRLFEECQELGIPRVWDENNGAILVEILNRLNFKEQNERTERSVSARRTDTSPAVDKRKSTRKRHDNPAAARVSKADAHHGTIPADNDFSPTARVTDSQIQTTDSRADSV